MSKFRKVLTMSLMCLFTVSAFAGNQMILKRQVLFKNVNIFDGMTDTLHKGMNVLVEENMIRRISKDYISHNRIAVVIEGHGKTLMPGLIEGHGHLEFNTTFEGVATDERSSEQMMADSIDNASKALFAGFTSWRDASGVSRQLKSMIDLRHTSGPRIYASGTFLTPSNEMESGKGKGQIAMDEPEEVNRFVTIANSEMALAKAIDNNIGAGATQIRISTGGRLASRLDPAYEDAYTDAEIKAAVAAAAKHGTYVMTPAFGKKAMLRSLNNGVKAIAFGYMFDAEVAKAMLENNAYLTTNLSTLQTLENEFEVLEEFQASLAEESEEANITVYDNFVRNINQAQPKLGFSNDCLGFSVKCHRKIDYSIYLSGKELGNFFTLKSLTSVNGEILKLTGSMLDPYRMADLGVVKVGAYADLLLVDGNPLKDLSVIGANNNLKNNKKFGSIDTMKIIMKDGIIYKNTLMEGKGMEGKGAGKKAL